MWYKVDFKILATNLLPTFLRKPVLVHWLFALLSPIVSLHYNWTLQRERNIYRLQHNGQVCRLRKVLNDQFDSDLRRIYINDGLRYPRFYIYTKVEEKPQYIYNNSEGKMPTYLRRSEDYADTGVDFVVWVPAGLTYDDFDMKSQIDFYKLANKKYKIEVI